MACRFGTCEINNNQPKPKKPTPKKKNTNKKPSVAARASSSSDWSDSDDSCSGCSACWGSSGTSTCSCSECNMETDSSDESSECCQVAACCPKPKTNRRPETRKTAKKPAKNIYVLQSRKRVCEWVPEKKIQKVTKPKKSAAKTGKVKKAISPRNCYDCC